MPAPNSKQAYVKNALSPFARVRFGEFQAENETRVLPRSSTTSDIASDYTRQLCRPEEQRERHASYIAHPATNPIPRPREMSDTTSMPSRKASRPDYARERRASWIASGQKVLPSPSRKTSPSPARGSSRRTSSGPASRKTSVDLGVSDALASVADRMEVQGVGMLRRVETEDDEGDISRVKPHNIEASLTYSHQRHESSSPSVPQVNTDTPSKRFSQPITQGHTAALCAFMRAQQAEGMNVPKEFVDCTVHITAATAVNTPPVPRKSSLRGLKIGDAELCYSLVEVDDSESEASQRLASKTSDNSTLGSTTSKENDTIMSSVDPDSPVSKSNQSWTGAALGNRDDGIRGDGNGNEDLFLEIGRGSRMLKPAKRMPRPRPSSKVLGEEDVWLAAGKSSSRPAKNVPRTEQYCSRMPSPSTSTTIANEEDPFLYIGKYILNHESRRVSKSSSPAQRRSPRSGAQSKSADCTCNHSCRTYLSGQPSQHCRNCRLPRPQPEILAVMKGIQKRACAELESKTEVRDESEGFAGRGVKQATQVNCNGEAQDSSEDAKMAVKHLQDMRLVKEYKAEMERRCAGGLWWEGWRVVRELEGRGLLV